MLVIINFSQSVNNNAGRRKRDIDEELKTQQVTGVIYSFPNYYYYY